MLSRSSLVAVDSSACTGLVLLEHLLLAAGLRPLQNCDFSVEPRLDNRNRPRSHCDSGFRRPGVLGKCRRVHLFLCDRKMEIAKEAACRPLFKRTSAGWRKLTARGKSPDQGPMGWRRSLSRVGSFPGQKRDLSRSRDGFRSRGARVRTVTDGSAPASHSASRHREVGHRVAIEEGFPLRRIETKARSLQGTASAGDSARAPASVPCRVIPGSNHP